MRAREWGGREEEGGGGACTDVSHSEHRFPAPSSKVKEECRKPVLGVCGCVSLARNGYVVSALVCHHVREWCLLIAFSFTYSAVLRSRADSLRTHDSAVG